MSGVCESGANVRDVICGNVGPGGVCQGDEKHAAVKDNDPTTYLLSRVPSRTMIHLLICCRWFLLVLLSFLILEPRVAHSLSQANPPSKKQRQRIPILQYHDEWVCVNKPAGLSVHRSANTPKSRPVLTTAVKRQLSR
jgi:23S rRNA-/tRNA-specific pseudouridylate synthase